MRNFSRKLAAALLLFASSLVGLSQDDPDPNSPAPVLASTDGGTRVLTSSSAKRQLRAFQPGTRSYINIYISNIEPLPGELRGAVRVYLTQKSGRTFELVAGELEQIGKRSYSLRVGLFEASGLRGQPIPDGDSLIYVTWRGLVSNRVRIALGYVDNAIQIPPPESYSSSPTADLVGYRWSGDRMRFQEQAAFGPSAALDLRIRRIGPRTWLADQFDTPYPTIPMPDLPQMTLNPPTDCSSTTNPSCYRERYTMTPLQQWFFKEALYGEPQLRLRVAWALSQIWVTSGVTVQQSSHEIAFFKILMRNAFGNYRNLLYEATLSPTMGYYLDMVRSTRANPNENYPREILQLFSIGLFMLNQDGSLMLDAQGSPIPTYDQETINNFSKVFTGWTYCQSCQYSAPGILNYKDPMLLVPANHDLTAKTLLNYSGVVGRDIPACSTCTTSEATTAYANSSLDQALNNIFNHPNVGPFIGKLLIQHLVTSDPSPAYVSRVAGVFNDNGNGIRGDMKAVVKAILLDPEARGDLKTAPRYGKLREPVQFLTNLGRVFPARDWNGENLSDGALHSQSSQMGQNPFYSPTVFNYYSPDYIVPQTTILAPEFEILNTTSAIKRTNILYTLVFEGITPNATDSLRGTSLDISELLPMAESDPSGGLMVDALNDKMMHGTLSAEHRSKILSAVTAVPVTDPRKRLKTAIYLIAASSQYQIQR